MREPYYVYNLLLIAIIATTISKELPDSFTIIIEQAVIMHLVRILRREKEMVRNEEEIGDLIVKRGCSF